MSGLADVGFPWQSNLICYVLCGLAGVGLFVLLAALAGRRTARLPVPRRVRGLIEGADGTVSAAKTQWLMWTAVLAGSYAAVFDARTHAQLGPVPPSVPISTLVALGLSTLAMIASPLVETGSTHGGLLSDDQGRADLGKVQLIAWTVMTLSIYIYALAQNIGTLAGHQANVGLPGLDPALVVLSGLSQAGYVGTRLLLRHRGR